MRVVLLLILVITFSACSYQKRVYRKGYYVDWTNKPLSSTKKEKLNIQDVQIPVRTVYSKPSYEANNDDSLHLLSAISKSLFYATEGKKKTSINDTCGDKMILKSGDEYLVKIIEITDDEIKYKRCDNIEGPLYSISKSKVYLIEYANGVKEHIVNEDIPSKNKNNVESSSAYNHNKVYPRSYYSAWVWFILGCIPFFYFAGGLYLALYAARRAKREIRENPRLYKGKPAMNFIMYTCLILISLVALILIGIGVYSLSMYGSGLFYSDDFILVILGLLAIVPVLVFLFTSKQEDFE